MIITACDIILTQDSLIWLQPESTQTPLISTTQQISNIVEVVSSLKSSYTRYDLTLQPIGFIESIAYRNTSI